MDKSSFQKVIYDYYHQHNRSFPWRDTDDFYQIMVSEFMLQQTQTQRVLPKYQAFIKRFPTVESLAQTSLAEVLKLWQGLGYNRRAKFLHESAKIIMNMHSGTVTRDTVTLQSLPGIGPYTAAAIATFAWNHPNVFIETNIRTVYIHFFFNDDKDITDKQILEKVSQTLDKENPREWYYALMDYGVYLKQTVGNVNRKSKHYTKQSKFEGSNRQIRGQILKLLLSGPKHSNDLYMDLNFEQQRIDVMLGKLTKEALIVHDESGKYSIK